MVDIFQMEFWTGLLSIVLIDLFLAGDNAIVIGLAARNIPKKDQKKVIMWGMAGAVGIRIMATLFVVYLLKIPGLQVVGGVMLLWIAIKLVNESNEEHEVKAKNTVWAAVGTIIVADAAMGIDNVLAVAGAAGEQTVLVIIGLMISVPVVVWGSTIVLRLLERFPWLILFGAGVLGWTASKMFVSEAHIAPYFENGMIKYGFELLIIAFVIIVGLMKKNKGAQASPTSTPTHPVSTAIHSDN